MLRMRDNGLVPSAKRSGGPIRPLLPQGHIEKRRALSWPRLPHCPLSGETGLTRYLEEIRRFPMLEPQEEFMLAKRWREHATVRGAPARHQPFAARGQDRHGLSRLWPADLGSHFRRQCRPDAGGQALRARQGLPAGDLRHVVDQGGDPGIHPALVVAGEDGHHRQSKEAVLQSAQGEEPISALDEGDMRPDRSS